MNLIDLMSIWAIKNQKNNPMEIFKIEDYDTRLDWEILSEKIVEVCGAMTPVHNTTESFVHFHKLFFKMWGTQISRLLDATTIEYEPLENYRRVEERNTQSEELSTGKDDSEYVSSSSSKDETGYESSSSESEQDSSTDEHKTSAYNESAYQPESQNITNGNGSSNGETKSTTNKNTNGESESTTNRSMERSKDYSAKENNVIKGMNGLFTPQQLIQQEIELAQYNIYQWIVTKYMEELFICVF